MTLADAHEDADLTDLKVISAGELKSTSPATRKMATSTFPTIKIADVNVKYPTRTAEYGQSNGASKSLSSIVTEKQSTKNPLASLGCAYFSKIFKKARLFPAKARPDILAQLRWCIWSFAGAFSGLLILALLHWLVFKKLNVGKEAAFCIKCSATTAQFNVTQDDIRQYVRIFEAMIKDPAEAKRNATSDKPNSTSAIKAKAVSPTLDLQNDKQATFYFSLMAYSFGASAVLFYDVPESPLSQPRNAILGHVLSAFVGITLRMFLYHWPYVCGPLAVAVAICVMRLAHATHPPGGATALLAAVSTEIPTTAAAYLFVLLPILSGSLILLLVAVAINNCSKDRKYPLYWF